MHVGIKILDGAWYIINAQHALVVTPINTQGPSCLRCRKEKANCSKTQGTQTETCNNLEVEKGGRWEGDSRGGEFCTTMANSC